MAISGVVSDGPLQGATACYNLNDNSVCDTSEPTSAATDANGNYAVTVLSTAAGQHAVVVNVPATAVDKTTGAAIGIVLTFKAPATNTGGAQSVFVSPLTTMAVGQMQATGASSAAAAAFIQAQAGRASRRSRTSAAAAPVHNRLRCWRGSRCRRRGRSPQRWRPGSGRPT